MNSLENILNAKLSEEQMSKVSELLTIKTTGNARPAPLPTTTEVLNDTSIIPFTEYQEFILGVTFSLKGFTDTSIKDYDSSNYVNSLKRAIINEVFGEFQEDLYNASMYISTREYDKARDCVENVIERMFDIR